MNNVYLFHVSFAGLGLGLGLEKVGLGVGLGTVGLVSSSNRSAVCFVSDQ